MTGPVPAPGADPRVLVLGGPTASGKSELAAELAAAVGGAVVSADSRQVFRGLEIGTAQPGAELRGRAPHYLVGFLSPGARYSAGRYGRDARRVLRALLARGIPAVLCGGTGLYLRAALEGVLGGAEEREDDPAAAAARPAVRRELLVRWRAQGPRALHADLARVDPALAARLHPRDRQRVLRGLEYWTLHGAPLSAARAAAARRGGTGGALRLWLDVAPAELERRIAERLEAMLGAGLLDEARALLARYGADPPASLEAVGYAELFAHLRGELTLPDALEAVRRRTRLYAKRQRTWFRHQDGYLPVAAGPEALPLLLRRWRERMP